MNLENLLIENDLKAYSKNIKKIFFFRICGTGMGAAACLLKEAGYDVQGGDKAFFPPMSTYLESTGIKTFDIEKVDAEFLKNFDLIVVGNSVPRVSEHSKLIESCGVKFTSFPSLIGELILKDKEVVGIAGTHGKTTTSYFLTQLLEKLGEDSGYLIGGVIDGRSPSKLGKSKYFVIESDEYDSAYFQKISKFRLYELDHMILTSLEFDHADIYDNVEQIENEFENCFDHHCSGSIIANDTYPSINKLKKKYTNKRWVNYSEQNANGPYEIQTSESGCSFKVKHNDKELAFRTNIRGIHNILNISACILWLLEKEFSYEKVKDAVETLGLVKRRQELRGTYKEAIVIDDFAHHPRAIEVTIDAIKQSYPDRKIITIFEPVSATARSNVFQNEFTQSFLASDEVILAINPLATTVKDSSNLDCEKISKELNLKNIKTMCSYSLESLQSEIDLKSNKDSLLLILSNRTCLGLWESSFVQNLT